MLAFLFSLLMGNSYKVEVTGSLLIMGLESPPYLPARVGAVELPFERGFRVPKIRVRI